MQTITFLINNTNIDTSSPNQRGLIALDILARANIEKIQVPINCAAFRNKIMPTAETAPAMDHPLQERGQQRKDLKEGKDWPEKMRSALMVVASLTATMAFQVGVNPPSGFWQDTTQEGGQSCSLNGGSSTKAVTYPPSSSGVCTPPHKAGSSIMANNDPASYTILLAINTTSFIASLSIILLLISGFTLRQRFFVWILMVIMWVAITCNALTYINSIAAFTPNPVRSNVVNVLRFITLVWGGLMVLLLAIHTVRLVMWLVRNIARKRNKRASSTFSTDA